MFNAVSVLYSVLVYFSFNVVFPFSLCLSLRKSGSEVRYEIRWRKMHLIHKVTTGRGGWLEDEHARE